ncbi:MAG TPA: glycosyltransferase [Acidimicrobiales bacterium]|nr:glycosyltransferase [Acidimicrobiales bacterium]
MRVLQVNKYLYRRGGAEAYMFGLADLLQGAGHEVGFFGMEYPANDPMPYQRYFPPQVDFEPPPGALGKAKAVGRMLWSFSAKKGLAGVLEHFQPDIVHCHNIYHQLSPSVLSAAADAGVPVVMTLHDYKLACPTYQLLDNGRLCDACVPRHFSQAWRRACRDHSRSQSGVMALELAAHTWSGAYDPVARFLCPSRFLADTMRRARVYPERLQVLPNFCDDLDGIATRDADAIAGPVVYAGRLSPEKGVDTLIDAVVASGGLECVIAGEGPERSHLEDRAAAAGDRIRFVGRLDRAEVLDLLRSGGCAAVPSRWHENQPMVILEAFACGIPVVSTNLGGLPDLVHPDINGLLVPPDDPAALGGALRRLSAEPELAAAMGRRARAYVEDHHQPRRHLEEMLAVYGDVRATRAT